MDSCREIRSRTNARLVKAYRKGRLADELGVIERAAKKWMSKGHRSLVQCKDPVVAEVRRIRDRVSRRLLKARSQGRLHEELVAIEAEGMRAYREAINGSYYGRRKRK